MRKFPNRNTVCLRKTCARGLFICILVIAVFAAIPFLLMAIFAGFGFAGVSRMSVSLMGVGVGITFGGFFLFVLGVSCFVATAKSRYIASLDRLVGQLNEEYNSRGINWRYHLVEGVRRGERGYLQVQVTLPYVAYEIN